MKQVVTSVKQRRGNECNSRNQSQVAVTCPVETITRTGAIQFLKNYIKMETLLRRDWATNWDLLQLKKIFLNFHFCDEEELVDW